jgi:hypothetical protein
LFRPDADLLAAYRAQTGAHLADIPRVIGLWRQHDAVARNHFSPADAEKWLQDQPDADDQDLTDLHALAAVWMNQP